MTILNWLIGAAILALLVVAPNERWIMSVLDLSPSREAGRIVMGLRSIISTAAHPVDLNGGFSLIGWLAVLLTFLLARVFAEGTLMRDDLEGTV